LPRQRSSSEWRETAHAGSTERSQSAAQLNMLRQMYL
jgi:hypothetical protein